MMRLLELFEETKVVLHSKPEYYGATANTYKSDEPIIKIPLAHLTPLEPLEKKQKINDKNKVRDILKKLKQKIELPPLVVRQIGNCYQILDGHHRYMANVLNKSETVPVRVVSPENIAISK